MPSRRVCSFCGGEIEPGTGKMFVKKDGAIFYFCSAKCERNLLTLNRVPRRIKWTKRYVKGTRHVAVDAKAAAKPAPSKPKAPAPEK